MNINTIITVVVYCLFFLSIIIGGLWGIKRGLKKSAIRIGVMIVFLIIAGLITAPISKAILNANISGWNLNVNGSVVTSISQYITDSLYSIEMVAKAAEESPSIVALINGLPVAIMNIAVFFLLTIIMQFISWIVFAIVARFALKESRLEKAMKKQKKLDKKNAQIVTAKPIINDPKAVSVTTLPPKRRWWGCLVGCVQGFLFLFVLLIPITSLTTSVCDVTTQVHENVEPSDSSLVVYAEGETLSLSEYSGDLIRNTVGNEIVSAIETFGTSVPVKILTLGGFDDVVFDGITNVKIGDTGIAIRKEVLSVARIYDDLVYLLDEYGAKESIKDMDLAKLDDAFETLFNMGIYNGFASELMPFALDYIYETEMFQEIEYSAEIQEALTLSVDELKKDENGFAAGFKNNFLSLLEVGKASAKSGLIDQIITDSSNYEEFVKILEANDYALLSTITDKMFDGKVLQIISSKGLNIFLDAASESLTDSTPINFGTTDHTKINWQTFKGSAFSSFKNILDLFDVINKYDFKDVISDPSKINDFSSEDLTNVLKLTGKQLDLIKNSTLFSGQTTTLFTGIVDLLADRASNFVDKTTFNSISSWETELTDLSVSFVKLKESTALKAIFDGESAETILDKLFEPVSAEPAAKSYFAEILSNTLNSSLSIKPLTYGLNEVNGILNDSLGLELTAYAQSDIKKDQKDDIVSVFENITECYTLVNDGFDIETLSTEDISKVSGLLTALQKNAFRIGAGAGIEQLSTAVDLTHKTVTNGGMFANLYISLVTYVLGDNPSVQYKTVNWTACLTSAKNLSSTLTDLGSGDLSEIISDLDANKEDLSNLLDTVLGEDNTIADDISNIQSSVTALDGGSTPEENLDANIEAMSSINDALTNLASGDDVTTLTDMVESATGENIADQISPEVIADEQTVSNRIQLLMENMKTGFGLTPSNLSASIADLTCGATYVLQQTTSAHIIITVDPSIINLSTTINSATEDVTVRNLVKQLFNIA